MKKDKQLGKAEWEIMEGLWSRAKPVSVREVHEHLYRHGEKAYTTVQTMMVILADKGFLNKEKIGMVNFFTPAVSREEAAGRETRSVVGRIFNGSFGALAAFLVDSGELSRRDLNQLKQMIEEKEKEQSAQLHYLINPATLVTMLSLAAIVGLVSGWMIR